MRRSQNEGIAQVAVGYVRVSTQEQVSEGVSLDAQRDKLRAYCKCSDIKLIDIKADEGISGGALERPGLQAALAMLRRGTAITLIVVKLDRIRSFGLVQGLRRGGAAVTVETAVVRAGAAGEGHLLAQGLACAEDANRSVARCHAALFGERLYAEPVDFDSFERYGVLWLECIGKTRDALADRLCKLSIRLDGLRHVSCETFQLARRGSFAAIGVDDSIAQAAIEPGDNRLSFAQRLNPIDPTHEGFLQQILSERAVADPACQEVQKLAMVGDQDRDDILREGTAQLVTI